jgi:hypothetical protein
MHKLVAANLFALLFALLVSAAPPVTETVDGTWTASFSTFSGTQKYTWELASDGEKLTGKVISENGEQQIKDGTIKGNKVTWTELVTADGNRTRMKYEGSVKGDKLKLTRAPLEQAAQGGPGGPGGFGPGDSGADSTTARRTK